MSSTEQGQASANGEVSAEDAESLAAQFRPAWELNEAPFAAGGDVSQDAVNALAGNGAPAAAVPADFAAPAVPPAPKAPTFDAPPPDPAAAPANGNGKGVHAKTMLGMAAPQIPAPVVAAPVVAAPVVAAPVAPVAAVPPPVAVVAEEERQIIRSERPPAIGVGISAGIPGSRAPARPAIVRPIVETQSAAASDQYDAIPRKSPLPMIIGVGAVVIAIAGVGIAVKFATDTPPKPATSGTADGENKANARPKNDIPPPPEATATSTGPLSQDIPVMKPGSLPKAGDPSADTPPATTQPVSQPVSQPVAQPVAPKPQPIAATPVAAPPPQPRSGGPVAAQPPQPPKPPKPPKGANTGGIVRDTPF